MKTNLEWAMWYAKEKGWFVFPAREKPGKEYFSTKLGKLVTPKVKFPYTSNGILDATRDEKIIKEWWNRNPNAAIGVNTGMSGLFVIDIDTHDPTIDSFGYYSSLNICDKGALHSRTGGGGIHVVFSGKGRSTKNSTTGVDTRSFGGYIVVPPSFVVRENGGEKLFYRFLDDWMRVPAEISKEDMEKIVPERVNKTKENFSLSPDELIKELPKIKELLLSETNPNRADNYSDWILCMYILKGTFGDIAFDVWTEWSKLSSKYDPDVCFRTWELAKPNGSSTLRTLYWWRKVDNQ